jgi:3-hydroxybutyryl-CoA dehydrogenase
MIVAKKSLKKIVHSKKSNKADSVSPSEKILIHIMGESPMVEEFAAMCIAGGYEVYVTFNETPIEKSELAAQFKTTASIDPGTAIGIELTNIDLRKKKQNVELLANALPGTAPILSSAITVTATEQSTWIAGNHRLVGIAALPSLLEKPLLEVAPTIYSPKETLDAVSHFLQTLHKQIEIVQDRVGMVLPRILCQMINEAVFAVTEEIALPQDIDMALKLGMNFPLGPIEWADRIGIKQVFAVINALHHDLQEERYRPAPLLRQMALTGEWWKRSYKRR